MIKNLQPFCEVHSIIAQVNYCQVSKGIDILKLHLFSPAKPNISYPSTKEKGCFVCSLLPYRDFLCPAFLTGKRGWTLMGPMAWSECCKQQTVYLAPISLCGLFLSSQILYSNSLQILTQYLYVSLPFRHAVIPSMCP